MKPAFVSFVLSAAFGLAFTSASFAEIAVSSKALSSGVFSNEQVFNGFGCRGDNISPDLSWSNAPEGTKAFILMMHDRDAPTGSGWWHWIVSNIDGDATGLPLDASSKGALLGGIETNTDYGVPGYGGPCPPVGDKPHHYEIVLYALPEPLSAGAMGSPAMISFMARSMALDTGSLKATYARSE